MKKLSKTNSKHHAMNPVDVKDENTISRRRVLSYLCIGGALVLGGGGTATYWLLKDYDKVDSYLQTSEATKVQIHCPKEYFQYGSKRFLDSIAEGTANQLESTIDRLTAQEMEDLNNSLISELKKEPSMGGRHIRILGLRRVYEESMFRLEPDKKYAEFLVTEAKKSLEHMV